MLLCGVPGIAKEDIDPESSAGGTPLPGGQPQQVSTESLSMRFGNHWFADLWMESNPSLLSQRNDAVTVPSL